MNRVKRIKDLSRMDYRASGKDTVEISAASSAASSVASSVTSSKRKKSESSESVMSKKSKKKRKKNKKKKGVKLLKNRIFLTILMKKMRFLI
jgi:FKBP-type peptidyl-prolyl cis-trans isomerase